MNRKLWIDERGFTLMELLVVIVIMGILVTLAIPKLGDARRRAKETQVAANLAEINKALASFGTDNSGLYPFRIRWFNDNTYNRLDFDPYEFTDLDGNAGMTSDANSWFSLGLIGGVRVVTDEFDDNIDNSSPDPAAGWVGMKEHKVVQPYGWDFNFYRVFNQYSDPLVALGYLTNYPQNPFLNRPMGNIMWTYGDANWQGGGGTVLNKTIPGEDVVVTPGDFVYTFFYQTDGTTITDPDGVVEAKKSYQADSGTEAHDGMYYLDMIDSYQLWAYGQLPINGGRYIAYPNNSAELSTRGMQEARKDWDNSGSKDMFEMGMTEYFKVTGSGSSQATDSGGRRVEF